VEVCGGLREIIGVKVGAALDAAVQNDLSLFAAKFVYINGGSRNRLYTNMKKFLMTSLLVGAFAAVSLSASAADKKDKKDEKKSAYPLKTCVVSDEKLGEMGKPYVMKYKGREVQLCCSSCEKDFKKDPDKYLKKLDEAEKKSK
jgi:YHS domain-containing protein